MKILGRERSSEQIQKKFRKNLIKFWNRRKKLFKRF